MPGIHENLKKLRASKGLTQEDVAQKIGLTRQAISSYESGRTQPGVELLMRFAEIYEVELDDVLYGLSGERGSNRTLKIAAVIHTAFWWLIHLLYDGLMAVLHITMSPPAQGEVRQYFRLLETLRSAMAIGLSLNLVGCFVLLVMDLGSRNYISWKKKMCWFFAYTVVAAAIASFMAALDPASALGNCIEPVISGTVNPMLLLAADIVIVELRRRRRKDIG